MKPNEQTKPIEDKSNNQSKATAIFNKLINKRKEWVNYIRVDYNNLKFLKLLYVGPNKDVSFYEYKDSKELFNAIKNNQIKCSELKNKQNEFLSKLSNIKIGKEANKQEEVVDNLEKFYNSREKVINFLKTMLKCCLMQITIQNKIKLREQDLKY